VQTVEFVTRRGERKKGEAIDGIGWWGFIACIHGNIIMNHFVQQIYANKNTNNRSEFDQSNCVYVWKYHKETHLYNLYTLILKRKWNM
jgi:hypothetical protein